MQTNIEQPVVLAEANNSKSVRDVGNESLSGVAPYKPECKSEMVKLLEAAIAHEQSRRKNPTVVNSGIYFLWLNGECVYVGQSVDVKNRLKQHRGNIAFDRYTVMGCDDWESDAFESRFIRALRPKCNSRVTEEKKFPNITRPMHARFATLDELIERTLPNFVSPVPCRETLRAWFDNARVPRSKANPIAKRGGGPVFRGTDACE